MTLRVFLDLSDPAARRQLRELLASDPGVVLVMDRREADVVVGDAAQQRRVSASAVAEAGAALTTRELEVLRLMADGLGNKEIAAALDVSTHTAKFHVAAVLTKLDARSRTEAVTKGLRQGLLPL